MRVFSARDIDHFGSKLPLWCPRASIPEAIENSAAMETPSIDDVIESMNSIYDKSLIDLASMFSQARETEQSPSPEVDPALSEFITDCKNDIQALNSKIPQMFTKIIELCRELSETTCHLSRRRDQLQLAEYIRSPPRHLPHDVLEQIFLWSWRSCEGSNPQPYLIPLQLTGVCHRWRSIALSTPILWSRIRVTLDDERSLRMGILFISRSRSISLSLDIGCDNDAPSGEGFMKLLTESPLEVSRLSLQCVPAAIRRIVPLLERHQSTLTELVLSNTPQLDDLQVPKIEKLYLLDVPKSWASPSSLVGGSTPLVSLRVLHIASNGGISVDVVERILVTCPQLQSLHFRFKLEDPNSLSTIAGAISNSHPHSTTITHHRQDHLENLSIGLRGNGIVPPDFLHTWSFPKLRTFSYDVTRWQEEACCAWLISHTTLLSGVTLLILDFAKGPHSQENFLSILRGAPLVESLVISQHFHNTLPVLASIPTTSSESELSPQPGTSSSESTSMLLNLKRIHIVSDWDSRNTFQLYRDLIKDLYQSWSPDHNHNLNPQSPNRISQLIVEVRPIVDELSEPDFALLSYIKEEVYLEEGENEGDDAKVVMVPSTSALEVQICWVTDRLGELDAKLAPSVKRLWPLPFNYDSPKVRILSDRGVFWTRNSGYAYFYDD